MTTMERSPRLRADTASKLSPRTNQSAPPSVSAAPRGAQPAPRAAPSTRSNASRGGSRVSPITCTAIPRRDGDRDVDANADVDVGADVDADVDAQADVDTDADVAIDAAAASRVRMTCTPGTCSTRTGA